MNRFSIGVAVLAVAWCATDQPVMAQEPQRLNPLIEKLAQDQAAISGVDWQFIDMEHGPYLLDRLQTTLQGLREEGATRPRLAPIVRIPMEGDENVRFATKQVLDLGAFGVVFPRVETAEQAERAVSAMRYPPQRGEASPEPAGRRGWGPGRAARYWGLGVADYARRADVWPLDPEGELFAMIMIESADGVRNIDEIVSVPGIGAIFIGPADLGMSLGVGPPTPAQPPETEAAIQRILKACKAHDVICGLAEPRTESEKRIAEGFRVLLAF
jgi:4-hydroxy-2-oxoheptanedioate aldolase